MINYYEVLGVNKDTSNEEIKQSYRKMAMALHPDRNPGDKEAEVKFKRVQEAYETLIDPQKKSIYDQQLFGVPIFNDLFDMMFKQHQRPQSWGHHIETEVVIDFMSSVKGCTKTINIEKREVCGSCKGTAAKNGKELKKCVVCDGCGKNVQQHGFMRFESACQSCKGSGNIVTEFCMDCNAIGYVLKPVSMDIKIPAGIHNGMKLCMRGGGDVGVSERGNLYCVIRVKPHPVFQREGINLQLKMPIAYSQMVLGCELDVPTLDGDVKLKIPPGTRSGTIFRIPGYGFVLPDDDESSKGDLLIKIIVDVPEDNIPEEYKELLKQLMKFEKEYPGESHKNFEKNLKDSK